MKLVVDHPSPSVVARLAREAARKIETGLPSGLLVDIDGREWGWFHVNPKEEPKS